MTKTVTLSQSDTMLQLKQIIRDTAHLTVAPESLPDTASLFDDCGLDSTSIVDLVLELESTFNLEIQENELDASLFATVSSLYDFVEMKRSSQSLKCDS